MRYLVSALSFFFVVFASSAATIHVPGDYPTIQEGLHAATSGDTVMVAPGTYFEHDLYSTTEVTLRGTDPEDWSVVRATVIDAHGQGPVIQGLASYGSILEGLTLTHGAGVYGGALNRTNTPIVRNCRFITNHAVYGGALCTMLSATIENSEFLGNSASKGGAVYAANSGNISFRDCLFSRNWADEEGGALWAWNAEVELTDCQFVSNYAYVHGGAVWADRTDLAVTSVGFIDNGAEEGGGVYVADWFGDHTIAISSSAFSGNHGSKAGGLHVEGPTAITVENVVFEDNSADLGSALVAGVGESVFSNCAFVSNYAHAYGTTSFDAGFAGELTNCIFWENEGGVEVVGEPTINYSIIPGGWSGPGGEGILDADPQFRSFQGWDYLLSQWSPAVDAGNPATEDGISDWHPRWPAWYPNGSRSDMGAYGGPANGRWIGLD